MWFESSSLSYSLQNCGAEAANSNFGSGFTALEPETVFSFLFEHIFYVIFYNTTGTLQVSKLVFFLNKIFMFYFVMKHIFLYLEYKTKDIGIRRWSRNELKQRKSWDGAKTKQFRLRNTVTDPQYSSLHSEKQDH